ncbi:branched-chain amino acid ABC transporter permease [Halomarina litorea]|uniref:branched-chain amino acid ABC transporter permease n=1 Tax=Halomarina litorea TaxID=2961595 RepID=UPI0020C35860|nr:branched-chain amino acid ABC transporter permease [Halomarina sp. BCD28]
MQFDPTQFVQTVIYGLTTGSVIAVGAVGLTLSYGVTRFINFAFGEFLTYGVYLTLFLAGAGLGVSLPLPLAALVAIGVVGVLGVAVSRAFFDPLSDRGALPLLITSIGVAFLLRNLLTAAVGVQAKQLPVPLMRPVQVAGVGMTPLEAGVLVVSVLTMLAVHLLLSRTMLGKKMRATSGNRALATVAGIDTDSVVRRTWFVSAAAGALAGILYGILFAPFRPTVGWDFLIVVFAATLLGGIGKPYGAMAGAFVVGLAMNLGTAYLSADYTMGYAFAILVLVLLFKPEGIAGGEL